MRSAALVALAVLGCGGGAKASAASDVATAAGVGGGGGGDASSSSAVGGDGGATSTASAATASSTAASSSTASAGGGGSGGAAGECDGQPDGASCLDVCGCAPCGAQPSLECSHGLCYQGACVEFLVVKCKVGGTTYFGCNLAKNAHKILWDDLSPEHTCNANDATQVGYCAPGAECHVYVNAQILDGVCQ